MLGDEADEPLTTARDDQVDEVVELQQLDKFSSVRRGEDLNRAGRETGTCERIGDHLTDGEIGVLGLGATLEEDGVPGADGECSSVARDVRAGFVDDGDDAQRHANTGDAEAVGADGALGDLANGIGLACYLAHSSCHARNPCRVEREPVEHRRIHALGHCLIEVALVRRKQQRLVGEQGRGDRLQRHSARRCRDRREDSGGLTGSFCSAAKGRSVHGSCIGPRA